MRGPDRITHLTAVYLEARGRTWGGLLTNAEHAAACNRVYERTYPGALALLRVPEDIACDAHAWNTWLTT
jgi:hypothetical protein